MCSCRLILDCVSFAHVHPNPSLIKPALVHHRPDRYIPGCNFRKWPPLSQDPTGVAHIDFESNPTSHTLWYSCDSCTCTNRSVHVQSKRHIQQNKHLSQKKQITFAHQGPQSRIVVGSICTSLHLVPLHFVWNALSGSVCDSLTKTGPRERFFGQLQPPQRKMKHVKKRNYTFDLHRFLFNYAFREDSWLRNVGNAVQK